MFFNDWYGLERILIVSFLAYVALIICLRISGKRTLAKWNAFDFVVTIALGSILATQILSKVNAACRGRSRVFVSDSFAVFDHENFRLFEICARFGQSRTDASFARRKVY